MRLPEFGEVGQVARDVGIGECFGDLPWSAVLRRNDAIARGVVAGSGHARRAVAVSTGCGPLQQLRAIQVARLRALFANPTRWRAWRRQ